MMAAMASVSRKGYVQRASMMVELVRAWRKGAPKASTTMDVVCACPKAALMASIMTALEFV